MLYLWQVGEPEDLSRREFDPIQLLFNELLFSGGSSPPHHIYLNSLFILLITCDGKILEKIRSDGAHLRKFVLNKIDHHSVRRANIKALGARPEAARLFAESVYACIEKGMTGFKTRDSRDRMLEFLIGESGKAELGRHLFDIAVERGDSGLKAVLMEKMLERGGRQ